MPFLSPNSGNHYLDLIISVTAKTPENRRGVARRNYPIAVKPQETRNNNHTDRQSEIRQRNLVHTYNRTGAPFDYTERFLHSNWLTNNDYHGELPSMLYAS